MTRLERRVFFRSLAIGALLTLMVLAASAFGLLDSLEYWLYDQRAIHCQLAEPPPTSRFVHLDIDDASTAVTALGRWPWSRKQIAQILDEIQRAHPSAVGLDIMFSEPEKDPASGHNAKTTYSADDQLVQSLRRLGNTVLAASFKVESGESPSDGPPKAIEWLTNDLEMTPEEFANRLRQAGDKDTSGTAMEDLLSRLRRRAMKFRIENELARNPANEDQLLQILLPNVDSLDDGAGLTQLLDEEYSLVMA